MSEFNIQMFEHAAREDGGRYWYSHEFMRVLGYETLSSFQAVLTKAMASCATLGIDPTEAFLRATVNDAGADIPTYRLTRFACFLVSMHADSRKPEVARVKTALAAIADTLVEARIHDHDFGRLEAREDLKLAEKVMSGVAVDAGLDKMSLGIFKDAGFRGMYNMSLHDLKLVKGLAQAVTVYDFMGLEELAGNLFRVTQTSARLKSVRPSSASRVVATAKEVGSEVRQMMLRNSGTAPEHLPVAENITTVRKRLKSAHRKMKSLDAPKNVKRLSVKIS